MSVDSRLDALETFQRQYENLHVPNKLNTGISTDASHRAQLDQHQAQLAQLTTAVTQLNNSMATLLTAHAQLQAGCIALQNALNEYRLKVRQAFHGVGGEI